MHHPPATILALGNLNDTGLELADERKVRVLEIRIGGCLGLGARHVLLPVDAITPH